MELCGHELNVGDYVKVRYATGKIFKGGTIKGNITELLSSHKQGRLKAVGVFTTKMRF